MWGWHRSWNIYLYCIVFLAVWKGSKWVLPQLHLKKNFNKGVSILFSDFMSVPISLTLLFVKFWIPMLFKKLPSVSTYLI